MSRPTPPACKTGNWSACNEVLKRQRSLMIWFDPEMSRDGVPTGRRGRQKTKGDTAVRTCLTMTFPNATVRTSLLSGPDCRNSCTVSVQLGPEDRIADHWRAGNAEQAATEAARLSVARLTDFGDSELISVV